MYQLTLDERKRIWLQANPEPVIGDGNDGCTRVYQSGDVIAKFYRDYLVNRRDEADAQVFCDARTHLPALVEALEKIADDADMVAGKRYGGPARLRRILQIAREALAKLTDLEVKL